MRAFILEIRGTTSTVDISATQSKDVFHMTSALLLLHVLHSDVAES